MPRHMATNPFLWIDVDVDSLAGCFMAHVKLAPVRRLFRFPPRTVSACSVSTSLDAAAAHMQRFLRRNQHSDCVVMTCLVVNEPHMFVLCATPAKRRIYVCDNMSESSAASGGWWTTVGRGGPHRGELVASLAARLPTWTLHVPGGRVVNDATLSSGAQALTCQNVSVVYLALALEQERHGDAGASYPTSLRAWSVAFAQAMERHPEDWTDCWARCQHTAPTVFTRPEHHPPSTRILAQSHRLAKAQPLATGMCLNFMAYVGLVTCAQHRAYLKPGPAQGAAGGEYTGMVAANGSIDASMVRLGRMVRSMRFAESDILLTAVDARVASGAPNWRRMAQDMLSRALWEVRPACRRAVTFVANMLDAPVSARDGEPVPAWTVAHHPRLLHTIRTRVLCAEESVDRTVSHLLLAAAIIFAYGHEKTDIP